MRARRRGVPRARRARRDGTASAILVPIDACYELVGRLRQLWRGFDGGREAHEALDAFFADVRASARRERPRRSRCSTRAPEPYAAVPTIIVPAADHRTQPARRCTRSRCGARSASSRSAVATRPTERNALVELFGEPGQWGDTLRPFLWTHVAHDGHRVHRRRPRSTCRSPAPTTSRSSGTKYFHALADGEIPLVLLFSGTTFVAATPASRSQPVAWHEEASYRLPVAVWRAMMDAYFPNSGWLTREPRDPRRAPAVQAPTARCPRGTWCSSGC